MWVRENHPPAILIDALYPGRKVAVVVVAISIASRFVAENDRTEEHLPNRVGGVDQANRPLGSRQLDEACAFPCSMRQRKGG